MFCLSSGLSKGEKRELMVIQMKIVKILIAGLFILNLFLFAGNVKADYIYLKDGSVISGVLVEEKTKLLIYRVPHGEMFINRENIDKIIRESGDKPLVREAEKYLNDKKFKQAIKTAGEALEIKPDSREALKLKQKAIDAWQRDVAKREGKIIREKEKQEQMAKELKELKTALKAKWGIAIEKRKSNYIIADVYSNCPLTNVEIKPEDILSVIHDTSIARLPIKEAYNLLLTLKKFNITIQRPVFLTREKITWRGTKKYVGLGISIEKMDKGIKITDLMPDGPAVKAGVLKNDIIVNLQGKTISSSSMDEIINLLKGKAGTGVKAVIERKVTLQK